MPFDDATALRLRGDLNCNDFSSIEVAMEEIATSFGPSLQPSTAFSFVCDAVMNIGTRERERRIQRFVEHLNLDAEALQHLARFAKQSIPWATNAILLLTPSTHRAIQASDTYRRHATPLMAQTQVVHQSADGEVQEAQTVALLGLSAEHESNQSIIRSRKLQPLIVSTLEALRQIATTGLCGIVVGASFWRSNDAAEHKAMLRAVCEISTSLFLRISTDNLAKEAYSELLALQKNSQKVEPGRPYFFHGANSNITAIELDALSEVEEIYSRSEAISVHLSDLTNAESRLIRLLTELQRNAAPQSSPEGVAVKRIAGGQSGAKVFLANPQDHSRAFVVKIDTRAKLIAEVEKYQRWIQRWTPAGSAPSLHSHGGCHALSYKLEPDVDNPDTPAETLFAQMEKLRSDDSWAREDSEISLIRRRAYDLDIAMQRVVAGLAQLNSTDTQSDGHAQWLHWPVNNYKDRGISISVKNGDRTTTSVADIVIGAQRRIETLKYKAIVHGDIHGRNILLRDRTPVFIDFASSGPGHPCLDLARLDATARASLFLMVADERECTSLCKRVYCDGASLLELKSEFPGILAHILNEIWIKVAISSRSHGVKLAVQHGGSIDDYLAMIAVVSAFQLIYLKPGSGIERAILGCLSHFAEC